MRILTRIIALACLCTYPFGTYAEDIDPFPGPVHAAGESANVLVILDNSSHWERKGELGKPLLPIVQKALAEVLRSYAVDSVNIGLMLYAQADGDAASGGYVRAAIRPMTAESAELYARQFESLDGKQDRGLDGQLALAQAEAYRYFSGGDATVGPGRQKTDVTDKPIAPGQDAADAGSVADAAVWALPGSAIENGRYQVPSAGDSCAENVILFISLGANPNAAEASRRARTLLRLLSGTHGTAVPSGGEQTALADHVSVAWSRFMAGSHYGVVTHVIDVAPGSTDSDRAWSLVLEGMADASAGRYMRAGETAADLHSAIIRALADVHAQPAADTAVGLPASAQVRGQFLNQVFMGQFSPDETGRQRWHGNLKQYKLGFYAGAEGRQLGLVDADQKPAIDRKTGHISDCARSYWTPGAADSYWQYLEGDELRGECSTAPGSRDSNSPDGAVVEKGGQAYVGRGGADYASAVATSRVVKTSATGFCGGDTGVVCRLVEFDVANPGLTASRLGAENAASRARYINWARGADTEDEDGDEIRSEYRPSLHGDVIHSQPLAVDHSSSPNEQRVLVYYGSNDGLLRAINGDSSLAHGGSGNGKPIAPGAEFWAFMPAEFYPRIKRLVDNGPLQTGQRHHKVYGPDGPLTVWQDAAGRRYLAMAMRRGGRAVYGFDITDTSSPELLWHLGCSAPISAAGSCAQGWEGLGQTWSPLQVAWQPGLAAPLLLMGGGYDTCEDAIDDKTGDNHSCEEGSAGGSIYVLDAASGAIVAQFPTERAVPGQVTIVPRAGGDRNISYAYAADTGGNVYRLSGPSGQGIDATPPARWVLKRVASLGCSGKNEGACRGPRKFISGPDVVRVPDAPRYAVLIGSGDREKLRPMDDITLSVDNFFYAFIDAPADPDWLASERLNCNADHICPESLALAPVGAKVSPEVAASSKGWRMPLRKGEQVVSRALTLANKVYFNTFRPDPLPPEGCHARQGVASRYRVDYRFGEVESTDVPGNALLPTPVAGRVELDDGTVVPFCLGCGAGSAVGGDMALALPEEPLPPSGRVYWKTGK